MKCDFSLPHYFKTLEKARKLGYDIIPLRDKNFLHSKKYIVLRHDVDYSIDYAYRLGIKEVKHKIKSSYFILLHSQFYNPFSPNNIKKIKKLSKYHEIGLHYEVGVLPKEPKKATEVILAEIKLLEELIGTKITSVSAHDVTTGIKPSQKLLKLLSKFVLDAKNLNIKYISDSTQNWREGCMCQHIGMVDKLQILTHPFLWHDKHQVYEKIFENFRDKLIKEIQECCNERINYRKLYLKLINGKTVG